MNKIVLASNRPILHTSYLHKLCEEVNCEVDSVLSGPCAEYYESSATVPYFYRNEYYERIQEEFPNANVIHQDPEKFVESASAYINKENILLLAEIEYSRDCIFQFLKSAIENHESVNNIICMALYMDSIELYHRYLSEKIPLITPEYLRNGRIEFADNSEGYSYLKKKLFTKSDINHDI